MNEEKFTQKVTAVLQEAQQSAAMNYHQEVTSRHVFQALVKDRDGIVDYILIQAKIGYFCNFSTLLIQLCKIQSNFGCLIVNSLL